MDLIIKSSIENVNGQQLAVQRAQLTRCMQST
jgi:hypothetical protein